MNYKSRYKSGQILKEKKAEEKFRRVTLIGLGTFLLIGSTVWIIAYYGCEIRYWYRLRAFYGKEIKAEWVCMDGNLFREHKTLKYDINYHLFNVCSTGCYEDLSSNFKAAAFATDTISGKKVFKSDAVIGLKSKKKPDLIYFENRQNFSKYYLTNR
jgi:hypothetical protein